MVDLQSCDRRAGSFSVFATFSRLPWRQAVGRGPYGASRRRHDAGGRRSSGGIADRRLEAHLSSWTERSDSWAALGRRFFRGDPPGGNARQDAKRVAERLDVAPATGTLELRRSSIDSSLTAGFRRGWK